MAQSGNLMRGDVNGDGTVNGTDIQAIINVVVAGQYEEKYDLNRDLKVNGTDIQEVINIIVNGPVAPYLIASPDTVYVSADGQDFAFELSTNVAYDYTPSAAWLSYVSDIAGTDSLRFNSAMNPNTRQRTGYVAFASKNGGELKDTIWVVQERKSDSRYIDIDWTTTTLNSFNEESGEAVLTFSGDVPVMGGYDVVLLPSDGDYTIRLIDKVQQAEDSKTVTLATRQGVMGNLFKGQKFTLATETSAVNSNMARAQGISDADAVYTPVKVDVFTGDEYVEIYNVDNLSSRGMSKAPQGFENEFINWEYNNDGCVLWESGTQSLSWDKLNFNIGFP